MLPCYLNSMSQISFVQFSFSLVFGGGMTFSHMDIGELINLRLPPSPSEALIEGALLVQCGWGLPLITHCVLL